METERSTRFIIQEADGEEFAVEEGLEQAKNICKKLGMTLDKIVSMEEVTDFGEEAEEEEDDEGEEEEEQEEEEEEEPLDIKDDIAYYKFVVECHKAKPK